MVLAQNDQIARAQRAVVLEVLHVVRFQPPRTVLIIPQVGEFRRKLVRLV